MSQGNIVYSIHKHIYTVLTLHTFSISGWIIFTHFYQDVHLVFWLSQTLRAVGLIALSLGHKGQLFSALTWGGAGDMAEELLDAGVTQGAPEGAGRIHVKDRVNSAADEHHGPSDEGHGAPGTLQIVCYNREGVLSGQDDE